MRAARAARVALSLTFFVEREMPRLRPASVRIAVKTLDFPTLCRVPDRADSDALAFHFVQDDVRGAPDD